MSVSSHQSPINEPRRIKTRPRVIAGYAPAPTPVVVKPAKRRRVLAAVSVVLIAVVLIYELGGSNDLRNSPVTGVDYVPVAEYVAARHKPGEAILTALPAPAYLAVGSTDDLIFLSSPINRKRAQRYTRLTTDGRYVDYWTGADSVVDVPGLCNTLLTAPHVWVLVDESRLKADWAYLGPMADVINGMTYVQYDTLGGAQVRRLSPLPSRDPRAEQICDAAMTGQPIPTAIPTPTP
jgi:hypothetical protein